ncbi:MAG: hypothetical protein IKU45_06625 [Clostridia bacterium]|nr:hypothetical protein [Clostridia bacterium]
MWTTCLIISIIALVLSVVMAIVSAYTKHKKLFGLDYTKWLFGGVAIASIAFFMPVYSAFLSENNGNVFDAFSSSFHYMFRLFIMDVEYEFIILSLNNYISNNVLATAYRVVLAILFVYGPILTFGFVMSFFKNVSALYRYAWKFFSKAYVFSELNEKTLALAESLNAKGTALVFTDVFDKGDEDSYEMIERAKDMGAICFKNDILTVNFKFHSKKKDLYFFVISENHVENIKHALKIVEKYEKRENTRLYVLSSHPEAEAVLSNEVKRINNDDEKQGIIIRRINEVQSLITRTLYDVGYESIFEPAYEENGVKKINAVIIGLGQHGKEMLKSLAWFGQMDGYDLTINAFDKDPLAKDKFKSICPELMKFSGVYDVETATFDEMLEKIGRPTYVFVALGNDEDNIAMAMKARMLCARYGYDPVIQAVIYNSEMKQALKGITNFKGEEYKIDFLGDIKTTYSEKGILKTDLEKLALARHLMYDPNGENSFWQYSYNYRSSIASVIHREMKKKCGIPGIELPPNERKPEDREAIRIMEHRRWNAYTRSEGYVYGGTIDKPKGRNDLAKRHNLLVSFEELPLSEQEKDDD